MEGVGGKAEQACADCADSPKRVNGSEANRTVARTSGPVKQYTFKD